MIQTFVTWKEMPQRLSMCPPENPSKHPPLLPLLVCPATPAKPAEDLIQTASLMRSDSVPACICCISPAM